MLERLPPRPNGRPALARRPGARGRPFTHTGARPPRRRRGPAPERDVPTGAERGPPGALGAQQPDAAFEPPGLEVEVGRERQRGRDEPEVADLLRRCDAGLAVPPRGREVAPGALERAELR